jgi:two-component system response regulator AtoC
MANGGTVFLDEVGEMPLTLQAKLLRVLEQRTVLRVGGLTAKPIDVRFVSATNRDIEAEVERGTFRRDLYYRLSGTVLNIPPLRERLLEIPPLARLFADRIANALGRPTAPEISAPAIEALRRHSWPGNIRELRNSIEQAVILCVEGPLLPEHLPADRTSSRSRVAVRVPETEKPPPSALPEELRTLERERILDAITRASGNQTEAAKLLGMSRAVLLRRLDAYGLPRPRKRAVPDEQSDE